MSKSEKMLAPICPFGQNNVEKIAIPLLGKLLPKKETGLFIR